MFFPVSNPLRIRVHLELGGAVSLTALHAVSGMSRCLSHLPDGKSPTINISIISLQLVIRLSSGFLE